MVGLHVVGDVDLSYGVQGADISVFMGVEDVSFFSVQGAFTVFVPEMHEAEDVRFWECIVRENGVKCWSLFWLFLEVFAGVVEVVFGEAVLVLEVLFESDAFECFFFALSTGLLEYCVACGVVEVVDVVCFS